MRTPPKELLETNVCLTACSLSWYMLSLVVIVVAAVGVAVAGAVADRLVISW